MTSLRHNTRDDAVLDAAREAILAVGWSRTTLTDIARRAGVSRMTLYRTWPDMQALLADLMTREWTAIVEGAVRPAGDARAGLVAGVVRTVTELRDNALLARIIDVDPDLLLPYLLDRRGRSQELVAGLLAEQVRAGQRDGSVRDGDPDVLARSVLLAAHGFTLSAGTMVDEGAGLPAYDEELAVLVDRYLAP